ncbi:hypothetical protein L218DRAFT_949242 [Marasmius fiardii PR-910]|nr:hypothetical protein L218DRAFT_949242 [Marasmius fiardii PR-910]
MVTLLSPPLPNSLGMLSESDLRILKITYHSQDEKLLNSVLHFLLYGFYTTLFLRGLEIINTRPRSSAREFHRISLTFLFVVASLGVPINLTYDIYRVVMVYFKRIQSNLREESVRIALDLQMARFSILFIMISAKSELFQQIFRCVVIFGHEKKRKLYPGLLIGLCSFVNQNLEKPVQQYVSNAFLGLSALINFTLTSVLAGRIWWLSRMSHTGQVKRFSVILVILLESGLLYIFGLAVFMVGNLVKGGPFDTGSVLIQLGLYVLTPVVPGMESLRIRMTRTSVEENYRYRLTVKVYYYTVGEGVRVGGFGT